ncbi:MAG TPA: hypothetical protein VHL57_03895, partial [Flavobacteriales bacterium]|nr:hypothetical protein [Flavobacteriales bacterium]
MRAFFGHRLLPTLALLVVLLTACDPTKRVPQGKYLLVENSIDTDTKELTEAELKAILKQKPNKKVLGQRFYLHLYNIPDPAKLEARKAEKDSLCAIGNAKRAAKTARKNERRARKNKAPLEPKIKTCRPIGEWLREDVGEAPVVLDSALIDRSVEQLERYLDKEGYFQAVVTDTVLLSRKKQFSEERITYKKPKAEVQYRIRAGRPYTLCTWAWTVDDLVMDSLMRSAVDASLLKPGMRFDADVIDKERTRVSDLFRSRGYLYFNRDLVIFDADTSAGDRQVDLMMRLERPMQRTDRGLKGTPEGTVYFIDQVLVDPRGRSRNVSPERTDTVEWARKEFLYIEPKPIYKPKALSNQVTLKPGDRFSQVATDRNYRRLTNLRVFDRVDITYDTTGVARRGLANCRVNLLPSKRQNVSTEGFMTNRGGFLGTQVSVNYRHKNLFHRLGSLQAQISVGLEAQQGLSVRSVDNEDASTAVGRDVLFNTIELGPELTLRFPRFTIP